jgi:hypothetical protein
VERARTRRFTRPGLRSGRGHAVDSWNTGVPLLPHLVEKLTGRDAISIPYGGFSNRLDPGKQASVVLRKGERLRRRRGGAASVSSPVLYLLVRSLVRVCPHGADRVIGRRRSRPVGLGPSKVGQGERSFTVPTVTVPKKIVERLVVAYLQHLAAGHLEIAGRDGAGEEPHLAYRALAIFILAVPGVHRRTEQARAGEPRGVLAVELVGVCDLAGDAVLPA